MLQKRKLMSIIDVKLQPRKVVAFCFAHLQPRNSCLLCALLLYLKVFSQCAVKILPSRVEEQSFKVLIY